VEIATIASHSVALAAFRRTEQMIKMTRALAGPSILSRHLLYTFARAEQPSPAGRDLDHGAASGAIVSCLTSIAGRSYWQVSDNLPSFMKRKSYSYQITLIPEDESGYTVLVPSLPGCVSYGRTVDEATDNAREAISLHLENLKAHRLSVRVQARRPVLNTVVNVTV